jgi:pyruvate,water dikinase
LWRARGKSPQELHGQADALARNTSHLMLTRLDRMARGAFKALLPRVRAALTVGEDDDALFYRAQRLVRRALMAQASRLGVAPDEVFDVPLDLARKGILVQRSVVEESRAARQVAERFTPPPEIVDGEPLQSLPPGEIRRGHPTAGRARGRVFVVRDPSQPPATLPPDSVLVLPAVLPSLAYLIPAARALVTEHGGATSHGATLAREYGVPAVLGVAGITALPDDVELFVDGAAGKIIVI